MSAQCEARVLCDACDGRGLRWREDGVPWACESCDGCGRVRCTERAAGQHESGRQLCEPHLRWQLPHVPVAQNGDPPW